MMLPLATSLRGAERSPFFAMAYGFVDRSAAERVAWLADNGYDGIAPNVWNDALLAELHETLASEPVRSGRLRVFGVYFPYDTDNPRHRSLASEVIAAGAPVGGALWITFKPVNLPEDELVALVRALCDEATALGSEIVLYPHDMTWCLDAEDTLALMQKVERPNLFTSLHLHQELRAGNAANLDEIIAVALDRTRLVSISGALDPAQATPGNRDWSDVVRPLGDSVYPVATFVAALRTSGYVGPVGVQNWRLPGDPNEQHVAALRWWQALPLD